MIRHTAQARSVRLAPEDRDDLCAEVFLAIIKNDFAVLRNFRGQSSLATYLTVVARRIVGPRDAGPAAGARLTRGHCPARRRRVPDPHAEQSSSG